jgi:hypothetical protein
VLVDPDLDVGSRLGDGFAAHRESLADGGPTA